MMTTSIARCIDNIDVSVISNDDRDLLANSVVGISAANELTNGKSITSVDESLPGTSPVISIYGKEPDHRIRTSRWGDREDRRDRRDGQNTK